MDRLHNLEVDETKEEPKLAYSSNIPTPKVNIPKPGILSIGFYTPHSLCGAN